MPAATDRISFQETWQFNCRELKAMTAAPNGSGIALLENSGGVSLFDHKGKLLWQSEVEKNIRTISISNALELLAVNEMGYSILYNAKGEILWKKRIFPALSGTISSTGNFIVFVTKEPTVVMTDRFLKINWVYRNLQKIPRTLAISAEAQTVAFACLDERGEGIGSVAFNGKHYDAFMGLDPLQDIDISADGQVVAAIDKAKCVYCINCVKSFGIWRGVVNEAFESISYADEAKQTLLAAKSGLMTILDDKGQPAWEHRFPFNILRAVLSANGQSIYYSSPDGRIGLLESKTGRDMSRLEFIDIASTASPAKETFSFKKSWTIELPKPDVGDCAKLKTWQDGDLHEYLLLWNGKDQLYCLNDLGEEIWTLPLSGGGVFDMAVSPAADTIMLATSRGVLGLTTDGSEQFKFFGTFSAVHVFASQAFLLLDKKGCARFYLNHAHFSHALETSQPINRIFGYEESAILIAGDEIMILSSDGQLLPDKKVSPAGKITFCRREKSGQHLLIGTETGEILFLNPMGEVVYRNKLDFPVNLLAWQKMEDNVFAGEKAGGETVIFRNRTGQKVRASIASKPSLCTEHEKGMAVATLIDEILLIDEMGAIIASYNFPDRVLDLETAQSGDAIYVIAEGTVGKFTIAAGPSGNTARLKYLEL